MRYPWWHYVLRPFARDLINELERLADERAEIARRRVAMEQLRQEMYRLAGVKPPPEGGA